MEVDARNGLEYWLSIDQSLRDSLFNLRTWNHLKVATENDLVWIRGCSLAEIESTKVLSLPSVERYYLKEAKLYLYGCRLPARVEPSLLWTPIQRGLKLNLPKQNFNYFGVNQAHTIEIIPSEKEYAIDATMVDLKALQSYVYSAPRIRLKPLHWTILNNKEALIVGTPLLPLQGADYYRIGCFLISGGWKLKFENMVNLYEAAMPDPANFWYLIKTDNKISKLNKGDFSPLNKGSVQQSLASINDILELLELDE